MLSLCRCCDMLGFDPWQYSLPEVLDRMPDGVTDDPLCAMLPMNWKMVLTGGLRALPSE